MKYLLILLFLASCASYPRYHVRLATVNERGRLVPVNNIRYPVHIGDTLYILTK